MHHSICITIAFMLFFLHSLSAQDMEVDGSIIFTKDRNHFIGVEGVFGDGIDGNDLFIQAGDSQTGKSGDLYLTSGTPPMPLFPAPNPNGYGGNVYIKTGSRVQIQNLDDSIAVFHLDEVLITPNTTVGGGLKIGGNSIIGNGNQAAYRQLELISPQNDRYSWILGQQSTPVALNDNDFYFYVRRNTLTHIAGWIQDDNVDVRMNFTGQHRSLVKDIDFSDPDLSSEDWSGLIVVADQNEYLSMSGGLTVGQDAIMIDESLPVLSLSSTAKDKRVFGVISGIEPEERHDAFGAFTTPYEKERGDQRVFVNSIGEGGIWVIDEDGDLSSGDYIVTSSIPGYGMRQESEFLANYTVAKITMDCNFDPQLTPKQRIKKEELFIKEQVVSQNVLDEKGRLTWEQDCNEEGRPILERAYKLRYLLKDGTRISKSEYERRKSQGEEVYKAAFVGCTYHCG